MKRYNRKKYRLLNLALCFFMVLALLPTAAFAAEYPYQYPEEKPYYEMSMYAYKVDAADAESYPTGIFRLLTDDNRTSYAYCADSEIYDIPGTAYKSIALSDYYGGTTVSTEKLRTIIQNSYPFISMNEMISRVEQSGISLHAASVPCYEMVLISAIQQAIYAYTNPDNVISVRFAGAFPKTEYEAYKPFIYQYNVGYNDTQVARAYPDIKADVEAVFNWLCSLPSAAAPSVPSVSVSFAAEVERSAGGDVLILYDLFDGFENYNDRLKISVTDVVDTNETLIFEKPLSEFVPVGEGRYTMELPDTISGNSLKITLSGYNDYEDVVLYESEKAGLETSQPFIGYGKVHVPFSKTEQIDMPVQTGTLIIKKTVSGRGADTTKNFTFTVTLTQNGESPNGNAAYGDVTFTNGTAVFTLKHNESKTIEGLPAEFTYLVEESDNSGYTVTVNGANAATASGIVVAGQIATVAFDNYKPGGGHTGSDPNPAKVLLTATKTLDGIEPTGNNFTFVLKDGGERIVQTKSNSGGQISFDPLFFSNTGTYKYTIEEVAGNDSSINYDSNVYTVIVKVTKSGDYHAEIAYEKNGTAYQGKPVFANATKSSPPVIVPGSDTVSVSVSKVWKDGGSGNRPNYVSVQLYRNGNAYGDTVILSENNNWFYTWSNLDDDYTWTVDEVNVPRGYTRSVTQSGDVWTITNAKPIDKIPQTGDNSNLTLWIAFACMSAAGLLVTMCRKRRGNRHRR